MRTGWKGILAPIFVLTAAVVIAGCGGTITPRPWPSSTPSATPTATPTPTRTPGLHTDVLEKMIAKVTGPKASYQINATVQLTVASQTIDYTMTFVVAGADEKLDMTATVAGQKVDVHMVIKAGKVYAKTGTAAWRAVPAGSVPAPSAQWDFLTEAPQYFVFDAMQGSQLQFHNAEPVPYTPGSTDTISYKDTVLDNVVLLLKPDGTPVSLVGEMAGTAVSGADSAEVTGSLRYTFSNVGKKLTIKAPI